MSTISETTNQAPGWRDVLSPQEIRELLEMRDLRSWLTLAFNWGLVFTSFALVGLWPNPLTIVLALFVIGARQLGFAVIMHDASHRAYFRSRALNDFAGNWLAAYPIWSDLRPYRPYHLQHHSKTGTAQDPDIGLVKPFPITPSSLKRKMLRDLTGKTGWKFAKASYRRTFGQYGKDPVATRAAQGMLITNLVLLGIVSAFGRPELYLLWVGAWLTTNTLVTRIRAIAEHALTPDADDPLRNTRTTVASWWERLLIAPNRVNYHLEHHLLMTVPHYNLPRMHRLLRERGALAAACVDHGYRAVLQRAASRPESGSAARTADGGGANGFFGQNA